MSVAVRANKATERDRDFRIVFFVSYPLFLIAAFAARIIPDRSAVTTSAPRQRRSIFAEASATAYRTLPYAF